MLAERLCLKNRGSKSGFIVPLSPNYIMSCDPFAYGCNGGMISQVLDFLEEDDQGVLSTACLGPY
jgi:hypothetical protein